MQAPCWVRCRQPVAQGGIAGVHRVHPEACKPFCEQAAVSPAAHSAGAEEVRQERGGGHPGAGAGLPGAAGGAPGRPRWVRRPRGSLPRVADRQRVHASVPGGCIQARSFTQGFRGSRRLLACRGRQAGGDLLAARQSAEPRAGAASVLQQGPCLTCSGRGPGLRAGWRVMQGTFLPAGVADDLQASLAGRPATRTPGTAAGPELDLQLPGGSCSVVARSRGDRMLGRPGCEPEAKCQSDSLCGHGCLVESRKPFAALESWQSVLAAATRCTAPARRRPAGHAAARRAARRGGPAAGPGGRGGGGAGGAAGARQSAHPQVLGGGRTCAATPLALPLAARCTVTQGQRWAVSTCTAQWTGARWRPCTLVGVMGSKVQCGQMRQLRSPLPAHPCPHCLLCLPTCSLPGSLEEPPAGMMEELEAMREAEEEAVRHAALVHAMPWAERAAGGRGRWACWVLLHARPAGAEAARGASHTRHTRLRQRLQERALHRRASGLAGPGHSPLSLSAMLLCSHPCRHV